MKFYPRLRINLIALAFVALFLRLSYWQWERHQFKKVYIEALEARIKEPPMEMRSILATPDLHWDDHFHRRVVLQGSYDFEHEMIIRNRRYLEQPGAHVLTPLHIEGTDKTILVDRGFVPFQYMEKDQLQKIRRPSPASFVGLIQQSAPQKFLAPSDPPAGDGNPWVEAWLRVDVENISKQLPYPVLPIFVEEIPGGAETDLSHSIVQAKDQKAEIFMPKDKLYGLVAEDTRQPASDFPLPQVDTVAPPSRHLGYVFEWGAMALLTTLIAVILQLRPKQYRA